MLGFTMIFSGLNLQTLQDMTLRKKQQLSNKMCGLSSYSQRHLAVNTVKVSETTVFLYREASSSVFFGINQSALGFHGPG